MKAIKEDLENTFQRRILEFLKDHHHVTVRSIAEHVMGDTSPKALLAMSRHLRVLHEKNYVGRQRLTAHLGASSPYVYSLLAKGARAVGMEKVPSQFYRPQKRIWHEFEEAKLKLEQIAKQQHWTIFEGDELCRAVLIYYALYINAVRRGKRIEEEIESTNPQYAFSLPAKIRPDMLLVTDYDLIVVIIAHPRSYGKFLKKRLELYRDIFGMVKIAVIALTEEQMKNCQQVLAGKSDTYEHCREKVLLIGASDIDDLPERIEASSLRFVQYENSRRILIHWERKEGRLPPHRFTLPAS